MPRASLCELLGVKVNVSILDFEKQEQIAFSWADAFLYHQ